MFHQTITTKITFSAYFYYLTNGREMSLQRTKYLTESVKDAGLGTGVLGGGRDSGLLGREEPTSTQIMPRSKASFLFQIFLVSIVMEPTFTRFDPLNRGPRSLIFLE
jgi:hypothetical protein